MSTSSIGLHSVQDASPNAYAWKVYSANIFFQLFLAWVMPGFKQEGLPVPSLGYKTLTYHCNALYSLYATMVTAAVLHYTGTFRLTEIIDNYGHLMSVAMIWGFGVSFGMYFIAVATGTQIRMSGSFIYDVFMGASLNPRIGPIDLKMWAEVRIPWVIVFFLAVSGCCQQYEQYGCVTPVRIFTFRIRKALWTHHSTEHGIHDSCDVVILERLVGGDGPLSHSIADRLQCERRRMYPPDLGYVS